jgi:hypothetical protein
MLRFPEAVMPTIARRKTALCRGPSTTPGIKEPSSTPVIKESSTAAAPVKESPSSSPPSSASRQTPALLSNGHVVFWNILALQIFSTDRVFLPCLVILINK